MLFYRKRVRVSRRPRAWLASKIRSHHRRIGTGHRTLGEWQRALLILIYMRGETCADLAASIDVGTATAWRYVQEGTMLAARNAPRRTQATPGGAGWPASTAR